MPQRHRSDGPYAFVWVRGLYGPEPQVWGEEAFFAPDHTREGSVLAMRRLAPEEYALSLRELAARYPPPADADEG
ncbi:MAG: hypothetical protein AB1586_01005 [Pseudomonadota bacterium]